MSNSLQNRAMPLFMEIVGLPHAGREAFVQSACQGDEALMREVHSLLAAHENAGAFLSDATAGPPPGETGLDPIAERPGGQIGPYKLLQRIGEGGFGVVFLAEQERPVRRRVALKVVKPGMDTRQVVARFEAERQALAMMDHAHIAKVLDAGATEAGRPYFVMELVRGVPITDYCDTNNLPLPERLELFVQVCQAVQHAHSKGIIHRDLKPSNVMVTMADGRPAPKIIDFGIAKATEQRLTEMTVFTEFRQMIGTPQYMSPEQAEMAGIDIDMRSDVYSLGVLLYELLVGSTPFDPRELRSKAYGEMQRMIREVEPPRPSTRLDTLGDELRPIAARRRIEPVALTHALRGELDWIVMRAMEKDRTRRYETADGLARDVRRYLADEPVEACPPSLGYRAGKVLRRHRLAITAGIIVCAALLAGTGVSTWQAFRATRASGLAKSRLEAQTIAQNATRAQLGLTKQAQAEALAQLFEARLAQARAGHLSRRVGQRTASLQALAEADRIARELKLPEERLLQLRNEAIACLALPDLQLGKTWPGFPPGSVRMDFDGALERYARVDASGAVSVRRVEGDTEIARLPARAEGGADVYARFSDDGRFLAVAGPGDFAVWKIDGPKPSVACRVPGGGYGGAFSPDSRQLAFCTADDSIKVYDLVSGRAPREIAAGQRASWIAFDPGGRVLATSLNRSVVLRDVNSAAVLATLEHPGVPSFIAWHPDGNRLAVSCDDHHVYLWDVRLRKQTAVLDGLRNGGVKIAFSHSGDLLATIGWEGVLRLWDARTARLLFSTVSAGGAEMPRFSPDDTQFAYDTREKGNVALWQITAGRGECRTFTHPGAIVYECPAMHPGGRLLAVATHDGAALWDVANGSEIGFIPLPGCYFVLFEPSGAMLTTSTGGLWRWPVNPDPARPGLLRIGPAIRLPFATPVVQIALGDNGRMIAVSQYGGGSVMRTDRWPHPVRLEPHGDARYVAISPDGRWVATGSHAWDGTKIWDAQKSLDAQSAKLEIRLPVDNSVVGFSPDGRWLATTGPGLSLWHVGSWKPGPRVGGFAFAFSPDSSLLAVETNSGVIRLVDPNTGHEFCRLEDPNQDRAHHIVFSPDGTRLIAVNDDSQCVHVWDLRILREELTALGLDWGLPPYPPSVPEDPTPLQVQVNALAIRLNE